MRSSGFDTVSIEIFNKRLRTVTLFVTVIFIVLVLRLWFLQILNGKSYRTQSENNRIHLQDILPFRGTIFDRNGELLVDNRPAYNLSVIPEEIQDREQLLKNLRVLIDLDPELVKTKLSKISYKNPFKPILLKENISRDELALIETNLFNLPGLMIQVNPQRHYIFEKLASHLIGYLGEISENQLSNGKYPNNKPGDLIGKYGVEGKWQKFLHGIRGGEQIEVDAAGRKLRTISRKRPIPGLNLWLTIDKDLQMKAEEGLKGKKGAIVAINPNNGEILALASSPSFNPNLFIRGIDKAEWKRISSSKDSPLQDRAISGQYPPGSVFKIAVALAGLEEGVIDPEEEIFCSGTYFLGKDTFNCWRKQGHGRVSFHRALVESCDIYFYTMGRRLGVDKIAHYARMFGLGKRTDFDLDYEREGLIPTSQWKEKRWGVPWQIGETISTAIGQSFVLVTPIQMARVMAATFNGGRLYQPKVIKWVGKEERKVYQFKPNLMDQIEAKQENIELIKSALIGVVSKPRGTGRRAHVKGMIVAGKTGTAQVIGIDKEKDPGEEEHIPLKFRDHAWFVAIAPADNPRLALAILVENAGHGGTAAAPIAKEMIKTYFGKN